MEKSLLKLEQGDLLCVDEGCIDNEFQGVQFDLVCPSNTLDENRARIQQGLSDVERQLSVINSKVTELNADIEKLTNNADGFDYAISVISGVITGLIDSFFVGETEIDKEKIQEFLEEKYHTANDSGYKHKDADGHWISSAMYHRLDDLAHHPSISGLIASILVRYFRLVFFIDGSDGKPHIFFADTSSPEVTKLEKKEQTKAWIGAIIGGLCIWLSNLSIKKYEEATGEELPKPLKKLIKIVGASPLMLELLKTVDVWVGHMMSDVSTSQGIPGIFLSLLKEISVLPIIKDTDFRVWVDGLYNKGNMNLSEWGGVVFVAAKKQALPVLINEALVRGFFFVRHLAEELKDKKDLKQINWNNVIPFKNRTVVRMLTISTGTFTAVDMADAGIRAVIKSGGFNPATLGNFVLNVNFVGVGRFAIAVATDVGMGIKKGNKENERLDLVGQQLQLMNVKVSYQQADMWVSAKDAGEAINEAYEMVVPAVETIVTKWAETDKKVDDIVTTLEKENEEYAVLETFLTMYDESQG